MDILLAQVADPAAFAFHPGMIPLHLAAAAVGALVGRRTWLQLGMGGRGGMLAGGLAGLVGPAIVTVPLRGCTFDDTRGPVELWLGVGLAGATTVSVLAIVRWAARIAAVRAGLVRDSTLETGGGSFRSSALVPMALLAPTLAVLALFLYWPAIETVRLSTRIVRLSAPNQPFVCLQNFTRLMEPTLDPQAVVLVSAWLTAGLTVGVLERRRHQLVGDPVPAWLRRLRGLLGGASLVAVTIAMFNTSYGRVFTTTLILSAGTVLIGLAAGLGIALLAFQPVRGQSIYRTFLIWPYAISPPIAGVLFYVMFDPIAGIAGYVVSTLTPWTLPSYRTDPTLARAVVILASVWKTLGFNILFYLAGLQTVPSDIVEAARIDGANGWQRMRFIILPSLSPITFFLIVTNLTYAFFEIFGTIDYLTAGGPVGATTDMMFSLVRAGRVNGSFGEGAAQSLILLAMVLVVTAWQFRSTGRRVSYGA